MINILKFLRANNSELKSNSIVFLGSFLIFLVYTTATVIDYDFNANAAPKDPNWGSNCFAMPEASHIVNCCWSEIDILNPKGKKIVICQTCNENTGSCQEPDVIGLTRPVEDGTTMTPGSGEVFNPPTKPSIEDGTTTIPGTGGLDTPLNNPSTNTPPKNQPSGGLQLPIEEPVGGCQGADCEIFEQPQYNRTQGIGWPQSGGCQGADCEIFEQPQYNRTQGIGWPQSGGCQGADCEIFEQPQYNRTQGIGWPQTELYCSGGYCDEVIHMPGSDEAEPGKYYCSDSTPSYCDEIIHMPGNPDEADSDKNQEVPPADDSTNNDTSDGDNPDEADSDKNQEVPPADDSSGGSSGGDSNDGTNPDEAGSDDNREDSGSGPDDEGNSDNDGSGGSPTDTQDEPVLL